jgi:hypothetical protein
MPRESGDYSNFTPVVFDAEPKYITYFSYEIEEFVASTKISFRVLLKDQNNRPVDVRRITVDGEEYANWGTDDSYIINLIATKIGLTLNP